VTDFLASIGDTDREASAVYYRAMRAMTPQQRVCRALELSDQMRSVLAAGIRHRHPEYDDRLVRLATVRLLIGESLFRQVHPGVEVQP
jgi:hypothetical protein